MQTKTMSLVESLSNIIIGVIIAFVSQLIIFGYYKIPVNIETNLKMTFWFTLVSLLRSYVLRRFFNKLQVNS